MNFRENHTPYLLTLQDKTFYVQLSVWWEGGTIPEVLDKEKVIFTRYLSRWENNCQE